MTMMLFLYSLTQPLRAETDITASLRWQVVNDTVMGGRSTAQLENTDDGLLFSGKVSLENNGGFASIRSQSALPDLSTFNGLTLHTASEDDRSYQLVFWLNRMGPQLYYSLSFTPTNTPETFSLYDFQALSYGRAVPAPPLPQQLDNVSAIGILIGDKQEGPFELTIHSIALTDEAEMPTPISVEAQQLLSAAIDTGVPLFNAGNPEACAAAYRTALSAILILQADALAPKQKAQIQSVLNQTQRLTDPSDQAWAYRFAIDSLLAMGPIDTRR